MVDKDKVTEPTSEEVPLTELSNEGVGPEIIVWNI